jgi:hypothetical protein
MTAAATLAPAPSKAAAFADEAEALGWEVERVKLPERGRLVRATRGDEIYEFAWHLNSRGSLVFAYGSYSAPSAPVVEVVNVKAALRDMAKVRASNGALLPFDPEDDDDATVLSAVAGHEVIWQNSITHLDEHGYVPRGGLHLKLAQGPKGHNGGARILSFPDAAGITGFRSVYLDQIKDVK